MGKDSFFGGNLLGQESWELRGENDARLRALETSRAADEATLALVQTGAWTDYIPTLAQSATVTKTITSARYSKVGRTVTVAVRLAVTGTGTASNAIVVGLPVTAAVASLVPAGHGWVLDTSAGKNYAGIAVLLSTTTAAIIVNNDPDFLGGGGSLNMTAALASGDTVNMVLTYEAAS